MTDSKPSPRDVFSQRKSAAVPPPKRERQRIRRHRRATYIAPQDEGKANPFAVEAGETAPVPPETPEEVDESNDRRLQANVPPHFGKL